MSWISVPQDSSHPWPVRLLLGLMGRRGTVSESVRLWARSPRIFLSFLRLYKAVDRSASPIEPSLRSLLMVRVSQLNVCPFCVDLNGSRALARGVSEEKLAALAEYATSPHFGAQERAALAFADAVTITGHQVTPELRQELRASFADDTIIELNALIAFQNMSSKFNFGLEVPAEGFCRVPGSTSEPVAADG